MKGILRLAFGIILATLAFPAAAQAVYADFTVSPESPFSLDTVTFTSTSGGGVTSLFWDLDNDGAYDDGTTETVTRTFPAGGPNTVRLFVWGQPGESGQKQRVVQVNNRPPDASLAYFPATPEAGEPVSFVSTSSDPDGTLASLLWDLNGDGVFGDATGATASYTFPKAGVSTVGLRVVDSDGAGAVATQLVHVAAKPLQFLSPFPLVRLSGRLTAGGVRITRLVVQAPPGANVEVRCMGHGCRRHRETRLAKPRAGAKPGSFNLLRFRRFERALRAHAVIEVFVTNPPTVGKYTRITVRKGLAPLRRDLCLVPGAKRPSSCTP